MAGLVHQGLQVRIREGVSGFENEVNRDKCIWTLQIDVNAVCLCIVEDRLLELLVGIAEPISDTAFNFGELISPDTFF